MCQTAISNQPLSAILKISSYTKRLMPGLLSSAMYVCTLWVLSAILLLHQSLQLSSPGLRSLSQLLALGKFSVSIQGGQLLKV